MGFQALWLFFTLIFNLGCSHSGTKDHPSPAQAPVADHAEGTQILTGADQVDQYVPLLKNARIGLLVNATSMIGDRHLVDVLMGKKIDVKVIFAPEHGFRGDADAGQEISDSKDKATGIPIVSIYGKKKGPDGADLEQVDVVIFDVQDVGARFYTYLSTLKYLMEACAAHNKSLLILDRPNPNGHYIDGPVLEEAYTSFVGILPVPVVHGMTLGELALMMNGEGWLKDKAQCMLKVISCARYNHQKPYILPVKPSPNLPNQLSVLLYPSLCLFEGTNFSVGRGTDKQFQVYGGPDSGAGDYYFTPEPRPGATSPFLQGKKCRGYDLSGLSIEQVRSEARINLAYLLDAYAAYKDKPGFFLKNNFINQLMGNNTFQRQVKEGRSEAEIRMSWKPGLDKFKELRKKYLLYPD